MKFEKEQSIVFNAERVADFVKDTNVVDKFINLEFINLSLTQAAQFIRDPR